MSNSILTCERVNRVEFFVKNCQYSVPGAVSRTRIIQPVTALDSDNSGNRAPTGIRQVALRSLLAIIVLAAIAYAADYGVFQYRLTTKRQPFGSVTVEHYDAVEHKNGKAELIFEPPVQQTCVNSLFPHAGDLPCWYLTRHAEQKTDI
jgi:hypothetical protein